MLLNKPSKKTHTTEPFIYSEKSNKPSVLRIKDAKEEEPQLVKDQFIYSFYNVPIKN